MKRGSAVIRRWFPEPVGVRLLAWPKGDALCSWSRLSPSGLTCCVLGHISCSHKGIHPYWHVKVPEGFRRRCLWWLLKGLFSCPQEPCRTKRMLRACGGAVRVGGPAARGIAPGSVLRPTCRHSTRGARSCRSHTGLAAALPGSCGSRRACQKPSPPAPRGRQSCAVGLPAARSSSICLVLGFFPLYLLS